MLSALYDFFHNLFNLQDETGYEFVVNIFGENHSLDDYFCIVLSYISLIIIIVLCCLFVYKIIKLIGGLIR